MDNSDLCHRYEKHLQVIVRVTLVVVLLFSLLHVVAQRPEGGGGSGSISGTVISSLDGAPIEFATVTVFSLRDSSMVTGGITDPQGKFKLEPVRFGGY